MSIKGVSFKQPVMPGISPKETSPWMEFLFFFFWMEFLKGETSEERQREPKNRLREQIAKTLIRKQLSPAI